MFYVLPCVILFLCVFSPFSIAITSLGEARANLSAFRTFVRFALVWLCPFPWCLGRAAVCDCGTPWTFLLLFFVIWTGYIWKGSVSERVNEQMLIEPKTKKGNQFFR